MGAMLELNWESIKVLCIAMGIRPAIRQMGLEGTSTAEAIRKRAQRECWLDGIPRNQPVPVTVSKPVPGVPFDPATALVQAFKDDMVQTRLSTSRTARKAAETLEKRSGEQLLSDGGQTMLNVTKNASLVHDWAGQGNTTRVTLSIQAMTDVPSELLSPAGDTECPQQSLTVDIDTYDPAME